MSSTAGGRGSGCRAGAYERTLLLALEATKRGCKMMFIGNGGSAAIASHMAIDFTKNGGMPALCFNDGAALTCLGNDFGYEEVFAGQLRAHARKGDVLFAISSSGSLGEHTARGGRCQRPRLRGDYHDRLQTWQSPARSGRR